MTGSSAPMGQEGSGGLAAAVLAILDDDQRSAESRVTALVGALDLGVLDAFGADRPHGVEAQILARAVAAAGRALAERAAAARAAEARAVAARAVEARAVEARAAAAWAAEARAAEARAAAIGLPLAESAASASAPAGPRSAEWAASAIAATLAAAEAYARAPGDDTYDAYFGCATNSYPYGTGEGHYGIDESCEPGSGCFTGAGTLYFVACEVGFGVVIEAFRAELVPWLAGKLGTSGV